MRRYIGIHSPDSTPTATTTAVLRHRACRSPQQPPRIIYNNLEQVSTDYPFLTSRRSIRPFDREEDGDTESR